MPDVIKPSEEDNYPDSEMLKLNKRRFNDWVYVWDSPCKRRGWDGGWVKYVPYSEWKQNV